MGPTADLRSRRIRAALVCLGLAAPGCFAPQGKDPEGSTTGSSSGGTTTSGDTSTGPVDPSTSTVDPTTVTPTTLMDPTTTSADSSTGPDPVTGTDSTDAMTMGTTVPPSTCGDGGIDVGEQCDDGRGNGDDKLCTASCQFNLCGDGLLCPTCGQVCDDNNTSSGDGCSVDCVFEDARVFVTKQKYFGEDLGGLAGADARCQAAADAVPALKGRLFRAWLSDDQEDAAQRVGVSMLKLVRTDGVTVAANPKALETGTLMQPINRDEKGVEIGVMMSLCDSSENQVWTGTLATGAKAPDVCAGWMVGGVDGHVGNFWETTTAWTDCKDVSCTSTEAHLYCVQVNG